MFYWKCEWSPEGVNLVASFCTMYHAFPEDVSCMVDEANSMMRDLFRKKPSDVSISGHSNQVAGIDTGQLIAWHHYCLLSCLLQSFGIASFGRFHVLKCLLVGWVAMAYACLLHLLMPWFPLLRDGLVYFDSLMEGGCIMSNISIVEEDSEDA